MKNNLTTEAKLKAIIEAQIKGGYSKYKYVAKVFGDVQLYDILTNEKISDVYKNFPGVLMIILDTEGLKASYGVGWNDVSFNILNAWHSGKGSNYKEAINLAYILLQYDHLFSK